MKVLIATDAWHPQINGVVRTLERLVETLDRLGVAAEVVSPQGRPSLPCPGYPEIRLGAISAASVADRFRRSGATDLHVATEGPVGLAARRASRHLALGFSTSFHTRFAEYLAARVPVPIDWTYAWLRRFHNAGLSCMVATESLRQILAARGFLRLDPWSRGVDLDRFRPVPGALPHVPRPVFLSVGRVAVEKNLPAFLDLDLPGTKVVVGDGPALPALKAAYPSVVFTGSATGDALAALYSAADVFVFPSVTDTFGNVILEALACGVPIAAFPVMGPVDILGGSRAGVIDRDLRAAALGALRLSRDCARAHAARFTWEASARQFVTNLEHVRRRAGARP
ncbi:glycosyltransferase family 4 protein [Prosthecomicrobium sp. N25]|uniref:glycosyltransferase family 4 protein n=1 Tax=Prosthecomicrobium sp. N25 TaxID=3129254 RepID=UPI003076CAB9